MKIGVTGTRSGMTDDQFHRYAAWLSAYEGELHHGDCVGVDVEVADLAKSIGGYHIICHPPTKSDLRAFHQSDEIRQPLSYLSGQSMIMADECDILLVIPYQKTHQSHGGTWLHA